MSKTPAILDRQPAKIGDALDNNQQSPHADQPWLPRQLLVILLAGLLLRVALAAWFHGQPLYVHDERDYDTLAVNLVRHGEFAFEPGIPTSLRPPLYPALLAAVYSVAGEQNHTAVRSLQALLSLVTGGLVYRLAERLYGAGTATWAAGLCAFYPSLLGANQLILTETVFGLWLCLACLLMQRFQQCGGKWRLVMLGLTLGLGALTRSVLWLFPPFLLLFLLVLGRSRRWQDRLVEALIPVAALGLAIAPWAVRNTQLQKTFTAVDVMGGRNFMMGNYEFTPLDRPWDAISMQGEHAWHAVLRQRYPQVQGSTQGQIDKLAMRYGLDYVMHHPLQTLQRDVAKFFHFWQLERELPAGLARGYWGGLAKPWVILLSLLIVGCYTVTMLLGLFGLVAFPPQDIRTHLFLLLVVAFVCAVHSVVFGHSRYHLPLMPLIMIYAAAAWTSRREILRRWRSGAFVAAAAICLVFVACWAREVVLEVLRGFDAAPPTERLSLVAL